MLGVPSTPRRATPDVQLVCRETTKYPGIGGRATWSGSQSGFLAQRLDASRTRQRQQGSARRAATGRQPSARGIPGQLGYSAAGRRVDLHRGRTPISYRAVTRAVRRSGRATRHQRALERVADAPPSGAFTRKNATKVTPTPAQNERVDQAANPSSCPPCPLAPPNAHVDRPRRAHASQRSGPTCCWAACEQPGLSRRRLWSSASSIHHNNPPPVNHSMM